MSRVQKILKRKTKWTQTFIENSGSREEAERRVKEWGAKGGKVTGVKKGFGANPEKAREAQRKSAEARKNVRQN